MSFFKRFTGLFSSSAPEGEERSGESLEEDEGEAERLEGGFFSVCFWKGGGSV